MSTFTRLLRRCAVPGTAVALALILAGQAGATVGGRAVSGTQAAGTLSWSATLVKTNGTVLTGTTFTGSWAALDTTPVFASVHNTGGTALTQQIYQVTATGTVVAPTVKVDACVGATWNATANTCAGTVQTLAVSTGATTTATLALAVGASVSIRMVPTVNLLGGNAALTVSVARAAVRAAVTTNS